MATRKGGKGRRRPSRAGSRKGKGKSSTSWYQSNWFLLIVAAAVLVGVQVYHQRAVERGEGSAAGFGEPGPADGGAGEGGGSIKIRLRLK